MERHTPDNHPSSEEKCPSPRHSDRGRAKNIENIGDSMRWRTGRPSPGNASEDPENFLFQSPLRTLNLVGPGQRIRQDVVPPTDELGGENKRNRLRPPNDPMRDGEKHGLESLHLGGSLEHLQIQ